MSVDWEQVALRRAKFLIDEARSKEPCNDQTVKYALRVISNIASVGEDASSSAVKHKNPRISKKAWELYNQLSDVEWRAQTVNEHPEPLKLTWEWILSNANSLEPKDILDRLKQFPMVTIAKDEDRKLRMAGFKSSGSPEERYKYIQVLIKGSPLARN